MTFYGKGSFSVKCLLCLALLFLTICAGAFAQVTKIRGTVMDGASGETLPFVNIVIPGTTTGTLTGFNGEYTLDFRATGDSIRAFLIGYNEVTRAFHAGQFQVIDFVLTPRNLDLPEVTIRYSGNPAERILDSLIRNKERNTYQSFDTYSYEAYTKIQLDANNISERFRNRKILKDFEFVWSYLDTSTLTGKAYLPVFLSETMSDFYFRRNPRTRREIIRASSISGLDNPSLSQFLGHLSEQVNIYDNFIPLFEKNFVSPVADFALSYYKYYLVDSVMIGNNRCYHLMFKPRRKQELTFTGNLWVTDTTWAVRKFRMHIADDANINFINEMEIEQEFAKVDTLPWMLTKDVLNADFNILTDSKMTIGFYGKRTSLYSDFRFNLPENEKVFRLSSDVVIDRQASSRPEAFWEQARPEKLNETEKGIYQMVDSVKAMPAFKTYSDILYGIFTGYLSWGKFELGPYASLFSYNGNEGARFRLGVRTANSLSKKIQVEAYLAYGTLDRKFKYGGELIWMFSKNPRRDLQAYYRYDVEQLGTSSSAIATDNLLGSLFHRGPNNKLTMVRDYRITYEHEWFTGFLNRIHFTHREVFPLGSTEFIIFPVPGGEPQFMNAIYTSEVRLDTRLSFRERYLAAEFARVSISSVYPIIQVSYSHGFPDLFKSDYSYDKLVLNLSQWFHFKTAGWSKYIIEAGRIWGTLPYPLLRIHDGNQTFFYDESSASLMNYYEFLSDSWVTASFTHHFSGLLFDHIPLLRKLKWREVAHVRAVYGTLDTRNALYSNFPGGLRPLARRPYYEAGAGIENIFRVIRIDAIWRLSHLDDPANPDVPKFGVFASLFFSF